jgi:hypothetical protein
MEPRLSSLLADDRVKPEVGRESRELAAVGDDLLGFTIA